MKPIGIAGIRLAVLLVLVSGCMVTRQAAPGRENLNTIKDIQVKEELDQNQVRIVADRPLIYTSYELMDPDRLIIDLAGTSTGDFSDPISVNRGGILEILPIAGEPPANVSRIEIYLSSNVGSQIRAEGSELIVQVENPLGEVIPAPGGGPEPPVKFVESISEGEPLMEPASKPVVVEESPIPEPPGATVVSDLSFTSTPNAVNVTIMGDGTLDAKAFLVKGNRLVVDIPGVKNKIRPNAIAVHHQTLQGIRIGQHVDPKKVRVVFDLNREVIYSVAAVGRKINVEIVGKGEMTETKPAPRQKVIAKEPSPAPEPAVAPAPAQKAASPASQSKYIGSRVSLDFQDADIRNILRLLADVSGFNMVISDDVSGKVTLKLLNVPWDQALEIVLKMRNLGEVREGNIIRVATIANITKQRDEEARAKETLIKAEDLITKVIYVNYAKAEDLSEPLKKNLSPRGDITIDPRTNTMIVKDIEANLNDVVSLVRTLDARTPQVMIEARIVQADSSFAQSLGIQWGIGFAHLDSNNVFNIQGIDGGADTQPLFGEIAPSFGVNLPGTVSGLSAVPTMGFSFGRFTDNPINLDLRLSAGELNGTSKTISSPRITTLDNVQAKIEQGESIPFQTTSQSGTQTEFIDANLTLEVTPHITSDRSIIMQVKAARNSIGSFSGPAGPSISKREATTEVLVRDGETTVIGGIFVDESGETKSGIPFLSKIPILGRLFKSETKTETKNELLIFLTPKIIQE